jgi:hypothetical protein
VVLVDTFLNRFLNSGKVLRIHPLKTIPLMVSFWLAYIIVLRLKRKINVARKAVKNLETIGNRLHSLDVAALVRWYPPPSSPPTFARTLARFYFTDAKFTTFATKDTDAAAAA